jgi:hypothetical protein
MTCYQHVTLPDSCSTECLTAHPFLHVPDLVTVSEADNRSVKVAGKGRVVSFWKASRDVLKVGTLLADV